MKSTLRAEAHRLRKNRLRRAVIIAFCNQKGGVGKTTTVFQFARRLVLAGFKVLLVDNDPQGNLTSIAARDEVSEDQAQLADVLSARTTEKIRDVIVPGVWDGLDVVPSSNADTLGYVRDELVIAGAGREGRLREALADVVDDYDWILIDCGPSLDLLTLNGLAAADQAVVVTQTALFSTNGLAQLLKTIENVRRYYNQALTIAGIIVNFHEEKTISGKVWLEEVRSAMDARTDADGNPAPIVVFEPLIPRRVQIKDSSEASLGLDEWDHQDAPGLAAIYDAHLTAIEGAL